jgi:hypothetical protein
MNPTLRAKLVSALSAYGRKQADAAARNPRRHHNPYAIGIYLERLAEVEADIDRGADPAKAICAGFEGPILSSILRATGLAKVETRQAYYKGCPVYSPATPEPEEA